MKSLFFHPLLGELVPGTSSPILDTFCGYRRIQCTVEQLREVAAQLDPWKDARYELQASIDDVAFLPYGSTKPTPPPLLKSVSSATHNPIESFLSHSIGWHVCDGVLAFPDTNTLRILAHSPEKLKPWLQAATAKRILCKFPLVRRAGNYLAPDRPDWVEFIANNGQPRARAAFSVDGIHLDLPLGAGRLTLCVRGLHCATVDSPAELVDLTPRVQQAAQDWLIRRWEPGGEQRLAQWVSENCDDPHLAPLAERMDQAWGGLFSVDGVPRFGGLWHLEATLHPEYDSLPAIQETPDGPGLLVSWRDIDNQDTVISVTSKGQVWALRRSWDLWDLSSETVATYLSRLALWGHPKGTPQRSLRGAWGAHFARELGLERIDEACDAAGELFLGAKAKVFERPGAEGITTWMRELSPEALSAWNAVVPD